MSNTSAISPATNHGGGLYSFSVQSTEHSQMLDITASVQNVLVLSEVREGLCTIFIPHTTAAVTVNECFDAGVKQDLLKELAKIVPWDDGYVHSGGNSAAHIRTSMIGPSITLIVHDGRVLLGSWQSIYFTDFDGGRDRTVYVKIIAG